MQKEVFKSMRYSSNSLAAIPAFFRKNKLPGRILALVLLGVALAVCWKMGVRHKIAVTGNKDLNMPLSLEDLERDFHALSASDIDRAFECENPVHIVVDRDQHMVEITEGGDYLLTGEMTGTIHIRAKDQHVHLFLNGFHLTSESGPAVFCEEADKLLITLVDGSQNTFSDSGDYREHTDTEACLYAACDLTINGTGNLTVFGYYKDAVRSRDVLRILGGNYSVKSKRTAFHGNDGILICEGDFEISSEKNGFKTAKKGADGRGSLIIAGGKMRIIAGRYSFVASRADIWICGCSIESRSVVETFDVGGTKKVQQGCIHER